MTTQTLFEPAPAVTLRERLANTPLDPERGRRREFTVIFAITMLVLIALFALARPFAGRGPKRSIFKEARSAALAALPYAYRH